MTDTASQSPQEFQHFHEHYVRDIEDIIRTVQQTASTPDQQRVADLFGSFFGSDAPAFMMQEDVKPDPEQILKKAMSKLSDASRIELVVGNLLEGVKGGAPLGALVARYEQLGLIQAPHRPAGLAPHQQDGAFLEKALGWARKLGTLVWRIGVNAIRTIPRFVKLKPRVRFGFVGPLPS